MGIPKLPPPPLTQAADKILARWCSDLYQLIKMGQIGGSASPLNEKGDLYTFSTADDRLAVGVDGEVLVADSGQPTGIKWEALGVADIAGLIVALAAKVNATRAINTTAPLTGGGDLSVDRTLAISNFTGDSGSGGAKGAVPAPASGDAAANKFLKANGSWAAIGESDVTNLTTDLAAKLTNPMTTKGDIIVADTGGTPTRVAAGTSGYALVSNGAGTAPSYQPVTAAGGGALVLLDAQSPSGVANLDFVSALSAVYDEYVIEMFNVLPASGTPALLFQFSTNAGSTWDTTAANYLAGIIYSQINANSQSGFSTIAASSGLSFAGGVQAGGIGISGKATLRNPTASVYRQVETHIGVQVDTTPNYYCEVATGLWKSNTAFNGIRIKFSTSVNIASGIVRLYGISH